MAQVEPLFVPGTFNRPGPLARRRFGKWLVIWQMPFGADPRPGTFYVCRCDCGVVSSIRATSLLGGGSSSCRRCASIEAAKLPRMRHSHHARHYRELNATNWTTEEDDEHAGLH